MDEKMTCSICMDTFKEPKSLPCGHVNCKECLKGLILCSNGVQFNCPICRNITEVPTGNDVDRFPAAVFKVRSTDIQGTIVNTTEKLVVGRESHVTINLMNVSSIGEEVRLESSKIEAELDSALQSGLGIKGTVELVSLNQIKIIFIPRTRGRHKLVVKVDGAHIINSPFTLMASMPPESLTEPLCTLATGLEQPISMIYSKGKVLITEIIGEKVTEIDVQSLGHSLKRRVFSEQPLPILLLRLNGANGLAHDSEDNFYVSTAHQLHKFNRNGTHIKRVGRCGTGQAEFMHPSGLRISHKGELYVCDSNNHRIQVHAYDLDLNFKRSFGSQGRAPGRFHFPNSIAFDSNGQMFVADSMNNRIQCFTSQEHHLYSIEDKNLSSPTGLLIHNDHIYVTDYHNHRVVVMSLSGGVVAVIGSEHLKFPEGITMDEDGFLYVASDHSEIVVF